MTPAATEREAEIVIRPPASAWRTLAQGSFADAAAAQFRAELGLPQARRIIMSGHQSQFWHPGILAKLFALRAAADAADAAAAWIVVDHDENDPFSIRVPVSGADGRLAVAALGPELAGPGSPACRLPAWSPPKAWPLPSGALPASTGISPGLESIRAALAAHARSPHAAAQVTEAAFDLATPFAARPIVITATALSRTALFADLVAQMRRDPARCIDAHNRAVQQFPRERVAPLTTDGASLELPLWSIGPQPGSPRRKVSIADLDSTPIEHLAPRALLLTGLMRLAGCDLFIHGLGGERYDRITERWFADWLGRSLAPTTMVTATVRLRMPGNWPAEGDITRAAWKVHRARHDPGLLGEPGLAEAKLALLSRINAAPRKSRERATLFVQLHDLLHESEHAHADEIAALDRDARSLRSRSAEAAIANDRTWAFPLYEPAQLASLRDAVRAQFA